MANTILDLTWQAQVMDMEPPQNTSHPQDMLVLVVTLLIQAVVVYALIS